MHRFFLYFLDRQRAEQAAQVFEREGFSVVDIRPEWDDPFLVLVLRREVDEERLPAAVAQLTQHALELGGELGSDEACS